MLVDDNKFNLFLNRAENTQMFLKHVLPMNSNIKTEKGLLITVYHLKSHKCSEGHKSYILT